MGRLYSVSERNEIYYLRELLGQITTLSGHIGDNFNGSRNAYAIHNTTTNPLLNGVPQNTTILLPAFAVIKRITLLGTGLTATAVTVDVGPVTSDPNYISPTPVQIDAFYDFSTLSTPTLAEQYIAIEAQGGDVTAGNIYIFVEYIFMP